MNRAFGSQLIRQPSIFLLKEDRRQTILTVFNWSDKPAIHDLRLNELGLPASAAYQATNVLRGGEVQLSGGQVRLTQPAHSVRVIKLIDTAIAASGPPFDCHGPSGTNGGEAADFRAEGTDATRPALEFHWNFGDGVHVDGAEVRHAFTQPGKYTVAVEATGLDGRADRKEFQVNVTGYVPTIYDPAAKQRFEPAGK